jgi:hypothetical protein
MSSSRADRRSGSLAGLRLCMVMHGGNSGGSRLRAGHHDLSIAEMTQPPGMVGVKVRDHDLAGGRVADLERHCFFSMVTRTIVATGRRLTLPR